MIFLIAIASIDIPFLLSLEQQIRIRQLANRQCIQSGMPLG
jgi:hypothetical protein